MNVLTQFSEKEENYLREQSTIRWEYEQGLAAAQERERLALAEKEPVGCASFAAASCGCGAGGY